MDNQERNIGLIYGKGALESTDLQELQAALADKNICLISHQQSLIINASIDFFFPFIQFITSNSLVVGLISSAAWDIFKTITKFAYTKFHNRKMHKVYGNKTVEETPNIHFTIGESHLVLPVDVDQDKYEYATNKFFEYVSSHAPNKTTYVWFNEQDGSITTKTEEQIINDEIKKHQ